MAHTYNLSYSEGGDKEDHSFRTVLAKVSETTSQEEEEKSWSMVATMLVIPSTQEV